MIPCDELRRHLMDFHYDLLCEWENDEIVRHLRQCPECRAQEAQARREIAAFDRWKVGRPPTHLWAALEARLRTEAGRHHHRPSLWRRYAARLLPVPLGPVALAGALLLLMAVGTTLRSIRGHTVLPIDAYAHDYLTVEHDPHPAQYVAATRSELACWLETRTGFPSRSPNLCPEGLRLVGVRICRLRSQAVGIWIYQMDARVALLFERYDDGAAPPPSQEITDGGHRYLLRIDDGLSLLSWKNRGRLFTFVAPGPPKQLSGTLSRCLNREAIQGLSASAALP